MVDDVTRFEHAQWMFETNEELGTLDAPLASSFAGATNHLTEIISQERRPSARDLSTYFDGIGHLRVATLTFGLTLLRRAYVLGPISRCHINPAVTIGDLFAGQTSPHDALSY